jgi:retron-type reverse transcriptase
MENPETPDKVLKLRNALYEKAKSDPRFRFYSLYDKFYRDDVLDRAYECCKANVGAPGEDKEAFDAAEKTGRDKWLGDLAKELREKTYVPGAVRRFWMPEPDGKMSPLGIPNLKDRVAQTAAVIVLGSVFEADFEDEPDACRKDGDAEQAGNKAPGPVNGDGRERVADDDSGDRFDSIPHQELMKAVASRVCDKAVLGLIKKWLMVPVAETDGKTGQKKITARNKDKKAGTPRGAPISPLLSNLYARKVMERRKEEANE